MVGLAWAPVWWEASGVSHTSGGCQDVLRGQLIFPAWCHHRHAVVYRCISVFGVCFVVIPQAIRLILVMFQIKSRLLIFGPLCLDVLFQFFALFFHEAQFSLCVFHLILENFNIIFTGSQIVLQICLYRLKTLLLQLSLHDLRFEILDLVLESGILWLEQRLSVSMGLNEDVNDLIIKKMN